MKSINPDIRIFKTKIKPYETKPKRLHNVTQHELRHLENLRTQARKRSETSHQAPSAKLRIKFA